MARRLTLRLKPVVDSEHVVQVEGHLWLNQALAVRPYDRIPLLLEKKNVIVNPRERYARNVKLMRFDMNMASATLAKEALEDHGYETGDTAELLALAAAEPELLRKFQLCALRSVWQEFYRRFASPPQAWLDPVFLGAYEKNGNRILCLNGFNGMRYDNADSRFLAYTREAEDDD